MEQRTLKKSSLISLRESNPSDGTTLNDFFTAIPIEGKVRIKVRRQSDFFSFYNRLQFPFKNYIFEDSNQKNPQILGTASFLFQKRNLHGQKNIIALACDLRIAQTRKAIINWSKFFLPQISKLKETEKVDHFITSINLTEIKAINAFLRPRKHDDLFPIYELIQKYNLVSIHGFLPFLFKKNPHIQVRFATENDRSTLERYIQNKIKNYELVPSALQESFTDYISNSALYSFSRFLIALDAENKIVGCTHPLSSTLLQDYLPQSYDSQANNFRQFLKFASFLGFARSLTRPFSSTNKEQTLNFQMLHFLFFDHPDVFKSLVKFCYKKITKTDFLIYAYQPEHYFYRPPKGTINSSIPHALYEIKQPDDPSYQTRLKFTKKIFLDHLWF